MEILKTKNPKELINEDQLGFGQYFTDHWFISKFSEQKGWYESRIEPYGKFEIDPAASVLHYAQALFEGMKAFRQQDGKVAIFRPEFNFHRMQEGAARLCLQSPPQKLFRKGLKELLLLDERWVPKNPNCSLYIRPTLVGTEAFLGVRPSREILFFIILSPVGSYYSGGSSPVKIWIEQETIRAAPGGLGATKAGANYAASLKAAHDAKARGFSQVLWLDTQRDGVEEVGTMNVFFVLKNEVVTPALNGSILAGGVRDSVLQLLRMQGKKVSERRITMAELSQQYQAGNLIEAFGTGTAAVITPIGEMHSNHEKMIINDNQTGPLSQQLLAQITGIQRGTEKDPLGWMRSISEL